MRFATLMCFLAVLMSSLASCPSIALTPEEVLVVYNDTPLPPPESPQYAAASQVIPASHAVAEYYAAARGIPSSNLLGLSAAPYVESGTTTQYVNFIATPISDYLSSHPDIKCIVTCYGVPSIISVSAEPWGYSVDSALTLLGNAGVLSATHWGLQLPNPYSGKNVDFVTFRDSADSHITGPSGQSWRLNYLVARLDGFSEPTENVTVVMGGQTTTVAIPRDVKALVDRSVNADARGTFRPLTTVQS